MIGRRLSHFRILDRIGEGGMGVVYRAEDEKLQRVVALKVLPPERLADTERRLRFVREARTAAAVTHPNIAVVYEIDEADGVVFIAMEFIEGTTLRAVIGGKPLARREALRLGVEIAEGLCAAHQAHVIHRDLKPDNILVTRDGRVKILDFGLAKLFDDRSAPEPEQASKLETISDEMTKAGHVLGTASYMSPEQARGLPVDARSDLFSFGIVLYEMVTGGQPFRGSTAMDVMSAILQKEAALPSQVNAEVPAELERIIGKCLEKEPGDRYQDSRDLVVDLRRLKRDTESQPLRRAEPSAQAEAVEGGSGRRAMRRHLTWSAAALVVVCILGVALWRTLPLQEPKKLLIQRQITANTPDNPVLSAQISPDGRFLAYFDQGGIQVLRMETGETQPLRLPDGLEAGPSDWLPDGTGMLVLAAESRGGPRALWNVSLLGGAPRKILPEVVGGYAMSPDGKHIAYDNNATREIWIAGSRGESARRFMGASEGETLFTGGWSPNSRRIVYLKSKFATEFSSMTIGSRDLEGGPDVEIFTDIPLGKFGIEGIWVTTWWLRDGRLVYPWQEPPPNETDYNLWVITVDPVTGKRSGSPGRLTNWVGARIRIPSATLDGTRLAVLRSRSQGDIYLADLKDGGTVLSNPRRLTIDERDDFGPTWTPDSRWVLFSSARGGTLDVFRQGVDAIPAEAVVAGPGQQSGATVTPDGATVLYSSFEDPDSRDATLMGAPVAGGAPQVILKTNAHVLCPSKTGASCVLWAIEGGRLVFSAWDQVKGLGKKLASLDHSGPPPHVELSPDGLRIAVGPAFGGVPGKITILTLSDGTSRTLSIDRNLFMFGLAWSPSMDALFLAARNFYENRGGICHIDMMGKSSLLLDLGAQIPGPLSASPDGRHLAYTVFAYDSNIWLLENF